MPATGVGEDIRWWCYRYGGKGALIRAYHNGIQIGQTTVVEKPSLRGHEHLRVAEIGHNFVEANFRRKGVFSKIISAMERFVSSRGISLLYVTPNQQSETAYRKLSYEFHKNPSGLLLLKCDQQRPDFDEDALAEISLDTYIALTAANRRLLVGDKSYFRWRFARPGLGYRFFRSDNLAAVFAVRPGNPGPISVTIMAELFIDGDKPAPSAALGVAQQVSSYLPNWHPVIYQSGEPLAVQNDEIIYYRNFPLAYKVLDRRRFTFPPLRCYQFTDSDYA